MDYKHLFWVLAFTFYVYIPKSGISKDGLSRWSGRCELSGGCCGASVDAQVSSSLVTAPDKSWRMRDVSLWPHLFLPLAPAQRQLPTVLLVPALASVMLAASSFPPFCGSPAPHQNPREQHLGHLSFPFFLVATLQVITLEIMIKLCQHSYV